MKPMSTKILMNDDKEFTKKVWFAYITKQKPKWSVNIKIFLATLIFGGGAAFILNWTGQPLWWTPLVSSAALALWGCIECINPEKHQTSHLLYLSITMLMLTLSFHCMSVAFFALEWNLNPAQVAIFISLGYPFFFWLAIWSGRRNIRNGTALIENRSKKHLLEKVILWGICIVSGIVSIEILLHYWFPHIRERTISRTPAFILGPYFFFYGSVILGYAYQFVAKHKAFFNENKSDMQTKTDTIDG